MTRNYAEEDYVKKGIASLGVSLGAVEGDVAQLDADGGLTLAAGGSGGSSAPLNWCKARITLGADLTVASAFYDFLEADFAILSQSGTDFSLGTDPDQSDGAIISASGGQFSAAIMLTGSPGAGIIVLDGGSTAARYLALGAVGGGTNPLNGMGIDGFVPVLNADGSFVCVQMCVSTDLIVEPGTSVLTGITLGFGNTVGTDSFPMGKTFNVAVWQTGTLT